MEMEEHSPSQGKPAKLPIVLCERPLSHLGAWLAYGNVWWGWSADRGWAAVKPTTVAPLDTSLDNPITSLSRP